MARAEVLEQPAGAERDAHGEQAEAAHLVEE